MSLLASGAGLLAVDPVPWARAQMAFTLAAHIILVPLGVSWACMTLVANWKAIRHGDSDALLLAQRWSKYMAVTFAVGAVTGTVLSFEFGLLWPRFMERWGAAFGIPFAVEGLFFFTEAIFIALYIFGWKRLRPWPHFLTGIPIVIAGIGGTLAVVAANAWMNQPQGFTLDDDGKVVDVDPLKVIFNDAWPYEASHMLVAAYLVGGFMVASVYAAGMLKGRQDRYHRLGFLIPFTVAAIATPIQMAVGDTLARWVYENEPTKFAAIELVPETESDVPETLLGRLGSDGEVTGGIRIPGLASWLSDPGEGTSTVVQGLDEVPADERPTLRQVNTVHLAWDVMVGLGTLLFLLSAWYGAAWLFRRDMPRSRLFLWAASGAGVAAVVAMEAGWTVTEVGRQPWIVRGHMKVEDAATSNEGVWATFVAVVLIYLALAATVVLVLRSMSRRFREEGELADSDVPYGPRELQRGRRRRRRPLRRRERLRRVRRGRLRRRVLGPHRRRGVTGRPRPAADRPLRRPGVGGQPRVADLHPGGAVDRVPRGVRVDHPHPLRPPHAGRPGDRAAGRELRVPQVPAPHVPAAGVRGVLRLVVGPRALLHGRDGRRRRLRPGARRRPGGRPVVQLDQPHVDPRRHPRRHRRRLPRRGLPHLDARRLADDTVVEYFRRRALGAAVVAGAVALVGIFVLRADARYVFDGLTARGLPLVVLSALCGLGSLALLLRRSPRGARLLAVGAAASIVWAWGVAQWPYVLPTDLKVSAAAAPDPTLATLLMVFGVATVVIVPALALLYVLDQRSLLPEESA